MAAHLGGCLRRVVLAVALCLLGSGSARAYTVKQTGSGSTVRWHRPAVTLRVDPSMYRYFTGLPVKRVASNAAHAWAGLSGVPELLISEGEPGSVGFEDGADPSNGVYLIDNWVLAESSLAVTVATFESSSGRIVDTDILVNPNHPFSVMQDGPDQAQAQAFDLLGVLTHEMGHVIGLGESFDVRMATMWPNIARGETHQRDLDDDDMAGAEEAYAGEPLAAEDAPASACSKASVVLSPRRTGTQGLWIVAGIALIALGLWVRRNGAPKGRAGVSVLAGVLLFTTPLRPQSDTDHERVEVMRTLLLRRLPPEQRREGILEATRSEIVPVRLAAAAVLERGGTSDEQDLATRMLSDGDPEVRRAARRALSRLRTAPPAARIAKNHPLAIERLKRMTRGAEVLSGEVVQAGVSLRNGLVWSRYLVHGQGRVIDLEIAGGSLGGYTQIVSEQEPPEDGDSIVVALRPDGKRAWAHLRSGLIYGGWLGDGPAIEW